MTHLAWHPQTQPPGLYALIDLPDPAGLGARQLASAMAQAPSESRPRVIQIRGKNLSNDQLRSAIVAGTEACRGTGVGVVVNDNVELAVSGIAGVVGLHLGQEDLDALGEPVVAVQRIRGRARQAGCEHFRIGVSTHDLDQVRLCRHLDIDYIGFGPVCQTASKQLAEPVTGFDALHRACSEAHVPVVAIGGLSGARAQQALACGARFVAMIGALRGVTPTEVRACIVRQAAALHEVSTSPAS